MYPYRAAAVAVALVVASAAPATASAKLLDQTFGTGGIVRLPNTAVGSMRGARAIVELPNGKLLVAGRALAAAANETDFGLARLNRNGSLDTTFGPGHTGVVATDFGGTNDGINALAVQADGKIIAVGVANATGPTGIDVAIARYTASGSLDTTFAAPNGKRTIPIGSGNKADYAVGVALQPGGKIVIGAGSGNEMFALARLESNGALDDGSGSDPAPADHFGTGGNVTFDFPSGTADAEAMLRQADGKLVLTGEVDVDAQPGSTHENFDWGLARFNANGSLDSGLAGDTNTSDQFGTGGTTTVGFDLTAAGYDYPLGLAQQSDGKIVGVGAAYKSVGRDWAFARLKIDGTLDNSGPQPFSTDGKQTLPLGSGNNDADAVGLQPDGKIVVAGGGHGATTGQDFALARLTSAGDPDVSFNTGGTLLTPVAPGSQSDAAQALTVGGGRMIAAGSADTAPSTPQVALVSYNQSDVDNDGVADARDNCPSIQNLFQANHDTDANGDACDPDDDNDGRLDANDNCRITPNANQSNLDRDGRGDVCDPTPRGKPSAGDDTLVGTAGADTIHALAGNDTVVGLDGPDRLFGERGRDVVVGGRGADVLSGGLAKDTIRGRRGNDTINARDGFKDTVECGLSKDVANVDQLDVVRGCEKVNRK